MSTAKLRILHPKSVDTKYTGFEPEWGQVAESDRRSAMMRALAWYNYHYDKKTAKQCVMDWLLQNSAEQHRAFARVPDNAVPYQLGWLCRMNLRGLTLTDSEIEYVNNTITRHAQSAGQVKRVVEVPDNAQPQITIQDRLRNRAEEIAGELEGMYDDMIKNGAKMSSDYKPIAIIRGMNLPPQMTGMIRDIWQTRLAELETLQAGRDADLVEGFGNFSKLQIRALVKITEQVLADLGSYVHIKRVEKKPRKAKIVSPEHRARKFKHITEFSELNLTGLPAAKLIDASEAWLYDTKKRKLIHLVADSHIGSVTVKNNMLVGFSDAESQQKTLRKPADTVRALMAASKPNARKLFRDIKTTETAFNGRGTENLMILRTW
jgi:hypothetical protein